MTRRLAWALAASLLLAGCSGALVERTFNPNVYTVEPGDTLYSIAWRYRLDPQDLARWNAIDNPDELRVGQRIRLRAPQDGATAASEPAAPDDEAGAAPAPAGETTASSEDDRSGKATNRTETVGEPEATGDPGEWAWPTEGRVVGTFTDGRVAGRGIDIAGEVGQPVKATQAGQVVYSGGGLEAYGRLVIIRHADDYISAYAHNDEVHVREGDRVTGGQQIARMGKTRDDAAMLHFEIRRSGEPVDPLEYLPPRD